MSSRRFLIVLISSLGLAALFLVLMIHPIENWRGNRAWDECRQRLAEKGESLDRNSFIPAPVPAGGNFFTAPNMAKWFVGRGETDFSKRLSPDHLTAHLDRHHTNRAALALVEIIPIASSPTNADLVIHFRPRGSPLASLPGRSWSGKESTDVPAMGNGETLPLILMSEVPFWSAVENLARVMKASYTVDAKLGSDWKEPPPVSALWHNVSIWEALQDLLERHGLKWVDNSGTATGRIVRSSDMNLRGEGIPSAAEILTARLREALGTHVESSQGLILLPKARTGLEHPMRIAVNRAADDPFDPGELRLLLIGAGSRAGLDPYRIVMTGSNRFEIQLKPSAACAATEYLSWSDQFASELDRIREALKRPYARMEGNYQQPFEVPVLRQATIHPLTRMLARRAESRLLLGEPALALDELTLLHSLSGAFDSARDERPLSLVTAMTCASMRDLHARVVATGLRLRAWREPQLKALQEQLQCDLLSTIVEGIRYDRAENISLVQTIWETGFSKHAGKRDIRNAYLKLAPEGWMKLNLVHIAETQQQLIDAFDPEMRVIETSTLADFEDRMRGLDSRYRPTTFLAAMVTPNLRGAIVAGARIQTRIDQAQIACALELFHLAHGRYPEQLGELNPSFLEVLPRDVMNGESFRYVRLADGRFTLYSVGLNLRDDRGLPSRQDSHPSSSLNGDWVWNRH